MPKWGRALRSMKAPGTAWQGDQQPATMDDYVDLPDDNDPRNDNGGVHINSGIPNHAFYLAATALGGYAWETAGRVWYVVADRQARTRLAIHRCGGGDRRGGARAVRRRRGARGDGRLESGRGAVVNVLIVRGGGIAGIATRTQLASDALPKAACRRLEELAARVEAGSDAAPGHPDETLYKVEVDGVIATDTETTLPEPVRALIDFVCERPERQDGLELPGRR